MSRTLVVGDIHGSLRGFHEVLSLSNFDEQSDQLILLGDYVDGWSESAQLVDFLIDLNEICINKPIYLRGNHDQWCYEWMQTGVANDHWLIQGGQSTVDSYDNIGLELRDEHLKFFRLLHNYYVDDKNRAYVHGGFISKNGLGHDRESDYYWDRDLWSLACLQHGRYPMGISLEATKKIRRFDNYHEIFLGHTTTMNWDVKPHYDEYYIDRQPKNGSIIIPMNRCNVWNMDTGAGFRGKLTIMDVDTKEFWQSDYSKNLYKNEKGRI